MNKVKTFDILLPTLPILILVISISIIYSLLLGTPNESLIFRQIFAAIVGIVIMFIFPFIDYRLFRSTAWVFYLISLVLLVFVHFFGKVGGGAESWINLKFFQLQPSELAKVFLIISLASFFSNKIGRMSWKDVLLSMGIFALPLILVLLQPDLGTALVMMFIYFSMLFLSRLSRSKNIIILGIIIALAGLVILSTYNVKPFDRLMHDYQKDRILSFINPSNEMNDKNYNVKQAQITIGSGGIYGRGLGHGSQSQLRFLPESHTDFIFAGVAESFGFIGAAVLASLFLFLILKLINIGIVARDNFGMLLAFGTAAMVIFQVVENIGMNLGLAPITGIPLPFSSYGGSSLVSYLFILGIIQSVHVRHKKISF